MTPERIAELRRLAEAATKGPWTAKEPAFAPGIKARVFGPTYKGKFEGQETMAVPDADFIAAARNALPELLDEVERLRAECEQLRADAILWQSKALAEKTERLEKKWLHGDDVTAELAVLRARCERLEKVREAAEALCEQVEYVKYYTADSTALSAIRSALAAALEATDGSI